MVRFPDLMQWFGVLAVEQFVTPERDGYLLCMAYLKEQELW